MEAVGTSKQQERIPIRWDELEEDGDYFILPPIDKRPKVKDNYRRQAIKNRSHGEDKKKVKVDITALIFGLESSKIQGSEAEVIASKGFLKMGCSICCKYDDHWSFECPYIALLTETSVNRSSTEPPVCQVCRQPAQVMKHGEAVSVRLINLPEETHESDLVDLVRRFGPLTRVCLSTDEKVDSARMFAVVEYVRTKDAEKAISFLNGSDYYNDILRVEWATPRQKAAYPPFCPSCVEASDRSVRVTNISEKITGLEFLDLFGCSGRLAVAYLDADKMTGSQTKFGIVEYWRREDAERVIRLLNGFDIFDLKLQVQGPFRLQDLHRDLGL